MTPKQKFLKNTSEFYTSREFKFLKKESKFVKVENQWSFGFIFDFTKWSDGTYVKMFLFVDYIPLRTLYKKIIPDDNGYGIAGSELGLTLNNNDFEITNEKSEIQLPLRNDEEINQGISEFQNLYKKEINDYFDRMRNLNLLDEIYNKYPLSFNVSNYSDPSRLSTALILAKLTERKNYEYIEKTYSNEMINNDYGILENDFIKVKEYLEKITLPNTV